MKTTRLTAARRLLLAILLVATFPRLTELVMEAEARVAADTDRESRRLLALDGASAYDVEAEFRVDGRRFAVDRVIVTGMEVYLFYRTSGERGGWSFPDSAVQLFDGQGEPFRRRGGFATGRYRGEEGALIFDKNADPSGTMTLSFEWYDRSESVTFELARGGEPS